MRILTTFGCLLILMGLLLTACTPSGSPQVLATLTATETDALHATSMPRLAVPVQTGIPELPVDIASPLESSPSSTPQPLDVNLPATQPASKVSICSPIGGIGPDELSSIISSPYDPPPAGKEDRHHGVDFSYYRRGEQTSIQGTMVQAVLPGLIAMALTDSFPYGNVIIVESNPDNLPASILESLDSGNDESLYTLYAHLEEGPDLRLGQSIEVCQPIGTVGKSGNAGIAHLHIETRLGPAGVSFSQMGYYLAQSTEKEKENYLRWRISGDFRHFNPMMLFSQPEGP